jgi:hypothetical protein
VTVAAVNLLPLARVELLRQRRRTRIWILVVIGYSIVLAMFWSGYAASVPLRNGAEEVSVARTRLEAIEAELARTRKTAVDLRTRVELASAVADHPDWSLLLGVIAGIRNDEIAIERLQLSSPGIVPPPKGRKPDTPVRGPWNLILAGAAPSQRAASDFVARLEALGIFESISLRETRERTFTSDGGGVVDFTVACTLETTPRAGGKSP